MTDTCPVAFFLSDGTGITAETLGNTLITDGGLAHLRSLRSLRVLQLWGTNVAGPGLTHLHGLRGLEMVSLPWKVRGRHRRRLRAALPSTTFT